MLAPVARRAGGPAGSQAPASPVLPVALAVGLFVLISAAALTLFHLRGQTILYGDAEAHLNIARRALDSRTPGAAQLGTAWLPLPHLLMLPFAAQDALWRSGLAGAIPAAAGFVIAGGFLFAATRRLFGGAAAFAAAGLFALNPNLLYLQSSAMTEPIFMAGLTAILYYTLAERPLAAGLAALAASLTRYEGWFLIPFVALYFVVSGLAASARKQALARALVFGAVASLGPLLWLAHNRWHFSDALAFYLGPYSARAIQGSAPYPGKGDWAQAWLYFRSAAVLCLGRPLAWLALAGVAAALWRRALWPVLLLALPGIFYVWSIRSAGTPIFVPALWPHGYYNTRYGLALLPLAAFGAAALVAAAPWRWRAFAAAALVLAALSPWLLDPRPDRWATWKEAQFNSAARRQWTLEAASFIGPRYRPEAGIFTSFGDLTGIFRQAGIPLRETLTGDNGIAWNSAVLRPDLFLREEWAVAIGGDAVQTAINRFRRGALSGPRAFQKLARTTEPARGRTVPLDPIPADVPATLADASGPRRANYTLARQIIVKGAPVIEIWRRDRDLPSAPLPSAPQ